MKKISKSAVPKLKKPMMTPMSRRKLMPPPMAQDPQVDSASPLGMRKGGKPRKGC